MSTPHTTAVADHVCALSHLDALESEAIHIFREVAGEFERPVLLFSGGKDSIVMLHLARKAFWPAAVPFSLLHVDTGHNFPEVIEYRDRRRRPRPAAGGGQRPGLDRRRSAARASRRHPQPAADRAAARRASPSALRRGVRRRSPRRGEGPRQGARLLAARRVLPVGPAPAAPGIVGPLQRPARARASTCGSSRCPTGPSWTSGSTSTASRSNCPRSTTRTSGTSSCATACG